MSDLRLYDLTAEFEDGPGECGSGGAYFERAVSPEAAIRHLLATLHAVPCEVEAVDSTDRTIRVTWNEAKIASFLAEKPVCP